MRARGRIAGVLPPASMAAALLRAGAALACAAIALGCGGKAPPTHYFQIALPRSAEALPDMAAMALPRLELGVASFHVDPPYDRPQIVRRVAEGSVEVGFHTDRLWVAPLAKMLPIVVGEHLMRVAGGFVSAGPPAGRPLDATLEGRVLALEEVLTPEGARAIFRLRLTLRGRDGHAMWSGTAEGEALAAGPEPRAMAAAMQEAVLSSLEQTRPAIVGALLALARKSGPGLVPEAEADSSPETEAEPVPAPEAPPQPEPEPPPDGG